MTANPIPNVLPYFHKAYFTRSVTHTKDLPPDTGSEVAFAGRSNAGKSSIINTLTQQKKLARTSKSPGRTQQLVFFDLDDSHRLVDLPGYGFAKVSQKLMQEWGKAIEQYLVHRVCLQGMVLAMDIRHPLKPMDVELLEWCAASELPAHVVLTKSDKLKNNALVNTRRQVENSIKPICEDFTVQTFSALKGTGREALAKHVFEWLK